MAFKINPNPIVTTTKPIEASAFLVNQQKSKSIFSSIKEFFFSLFGYVSSKQLIADRVSDINKLQAQLQKLKNASQITDHGKISSFAPPNSNINQIQKLEHQIEKQFATIIKIELHSGNYCVLDKLNNPNALESALRFIESNLSRLRNLERTSGSNIRIKHQITKALINKRLIKERQINNLENKILASTNVSRIDSDAKINLKTEIDVVETELQQELVNLNNQLIAVGVKNGIESLDWGLYLDNCSKAK